MKRSILLVLLFLPIVLPAQYTYNYLYIQHPQQTWRYGQGTISEALVSIRPKGAYTQHDVYMTFTAKDLGFTSADSVEVQMELSLPKEAVVTDLWLWMDSTTIMKGLLLDRWTASSIYENIVKRRRDPALLMKNSDYQYSLRIYPMVGTSSRKIKITYLLPSTVSSTALSTALPMNLFRVSKTPLNKVTVFYWPSVGEGRPSIAEVPNAFYPAIRMDNVTEKQFCYGEILSASINNSATLKMTRSSAVFAGRYADPVKSGEGYFQVSFNPSTVFNINTAQKMALLFEFDESRSSYSTITMMNTVKTFLLTNCTPKDSINLIFSGTQIKRVKSSGWIGVDSASVNAAFDQITQNMLQNSSNLQALIMNGIDFIRHNGNDGVLWLIAGTDAYSNYAVANPAVGSIAELMKPAIPLHILDISNWNVTYSYFNNKYYYGNDYIYDNLSRITGSTYTSYRQNSTLQSNMQAIMDQIRGTLRSFDLITRIENGFCSNRYTVGVVVTTDIPVDRTITQIGRYKGNFPFVLEVAGVYRDKVMSAKVTLAESSMVNLDQAQEAIWAGNYVSALEALPQSNANTKLIVDASLTYRVLSKYSAFLALEPNDTLKACLTCRDETKLTPVERHGDALVPQNDSLLTAFPNPFNPETRIRVRMPLGAEGRESTLRIFNVMGQAVTTLDISALSSGAVADIRWNGTGEDGRKLASGVYIAVLTTPVRRATTKLLMMK